MRVPVLSFWPSIVLSLLLLLSVVGLDYCSRPVPKEYNQEQLELSVSELIALAPKASRITKLKGITLFLSPETRAMPKAIQAFDQLERLSIVGIGNYCSLESIETLKQLQVLEVYRVKDNHMLDHAAELPSLREIHMTRCQLERLSPKLSQLKRLTVLDVSYNALQINHHLEDIMLLPQLRALRLDNNPIDCFPVRLLQHKRLRYLSMQYCNLESTHAEEALFVQDAPLSELYLDHNVLTQLPLEVSQLIRLQTFSASYNQLDTLPSTFISHQTLQQLDLSNNAIPRLPNGWIKGKHLAYLNVSYNELTELPEALGRSPALIHLDASFNQLDSVPLFINYRSALRRVNLYGNLMDTLPPTLSNLFRLEIALVGGPQSVFRYNTMGHRQALEFDQHWEQKLLESYSTQPNSPLHQLF